MFRQSGILRFINHYVSKHNKYCKREAQYIWVNFPGYLSYVLLMIFIDIKCQWEFIMAKTRKSNLMLSLPTYGRRGIRAQKSDSLCGVFNFRQELD